MACFLALETGGHLLNEVASGALLLEVCDDQNIPQGGSSRQTYELSRHKWQVDQYNKLEKQKAQALKDLQAKERQIAKLEAKRLKDLADQSMQIELLGLMHQLDQLQQERLLLEKAIRFYQIEQDDILVILYALPFLA